MIDIKELLKAGVHFGHKTCKWSPKMAPFIWGAKNKIHLIDISKTAILLQRSADFLKQVTSEGKLVLWVGTKKAAQKTIISTAAELKMPYVVHRWVGGTLSNFSEIKKAITRLLHLRDALNKSASRFTKKEASVIQKEIARLEKNVGGILNLTSKPGAVVVIDAQKERAAIKEALSLGIPVVAMIDTNTDPAGINFVIPANDDATKSIDVIINYLGQAVKAGHEEYELNNQAKIEESRAKSKKATTPVETVAVEVAAAPTIDENLQKELIQAGIIGDEDESSKERKKTTRPTAPVRKRTTSKG
ncbi:TPA: 30S ribosomal protein S2 [Candidatus Dependentiae bacterium]|nr:MAG: 30S ribosomal protein S2 [candidate division TM6 bacterium GW2011_GWF2_33_332]HBS48095.1 30S ribosomal protein S2 [Candidatus Dependentiae bacterium]HBZ73519.1 30S ribosomal protein S2 [Candidatus Dependentiae bacterium]